MTDKLEIIKQVRQFNRDYTVIIGLLNKNFLDTPYSVIETRILFELRENNEMTANSLIDILQLDKSYMSRIIKSFEKKELIEKRISLDDKRYYYLSLTPKGKNEVDNLINVSNEQINKLLIPLSEADCNELVQAMSVISNYLTQK